MKTYNSGKSEIYVMAIAILVFIIMLLNSCQPLYEITVQCEHKDRQYGSMPFSEPIDNQILQYNGDAFKWISAITEIEESPINEDTIYHRYKRDKDGSKK